MHPEINWLQPAEMNLINPFYPPNKLSTLKVLKFGGTSLGSAERIRVATDITRANENCIVVCSAMSGMTNSLIQVAQSWENGETETALSQLETIRHPFDSHCSQLINNSDILSETGAIFNEVASLINGIFIPIYRSRVIALGEQVTSRMVCRYLQHIGNPAVLLDATSFLHLNDHDEPVVEDIARRFSADPLFSGKGIFVTQGFICRNHQGEVATLSRGGSDFTATLVGAALNAELIEIWTDIDGMHNNDPRHVAGTRPIRELSYTEAAELAYFGAKILHPTCVRPAREKNVPVCIKNTFDPSAPGTTIQAETPSTGIRAIAAKDNINILRITSGRMFNAYGFLAKVFEVFRKHRVPVDVVTTSEVSVSVTIEDATGLAPLLEELGQLGQVDLETDRCIICVVGDVLQPGHIACILQHLKVFDIRMVSLGASSNNITFVLPIAQKVEALNALQPVLSHSTDKSLALCTTTGS